MSNNYTFDYFRRINLVISIFGAIFFITLALSGKEIFSNQGVWPNHSIFSPHYFPSLFYLNDGPNFVFIIGILASLFCFFLNSERTRRTSAFILWYLLASFAARNPFVHSFTFDYFGIILFSLFLIPSKKDSWEMPSLLLIGYNLIWALGYTASGISKCFSEPWTEGSAVATILSSGRGMDIWLTNFILSMPTEFLKLGSYSFLLIEILALPLFLFSKKTRLIYFISILFMHICIGATTYITKMSVFIVLAHFLLNPLFIENLYPKKFLSGPSHA